MLVLRGEPHNVLGVESIDDHVPYTSLKVRFERVWVLSEPQVSLTAGMGS